MWTPITRAQHRRDGLRFASDMTDAEWRVLTTHPHTYHPAVVSRQVV
jgi:hypothetical protein